MNENNAQLRLCYKHVVWFSSQMPKRLIARVRFFVRQTIAMPSAGGAAWGLNECFEGIAAFFVRNQIGLRFKRMLISAMRRMNLPKVLWRWPLRIKVAAWC